MSTEIPPFNLPGRQMPQILGNRPHRSLWAVLDRAG